MKNIKFLFLAFFFMSIWNANAQNGWVKNKNSFYAQASISTFSSNKYYNTSGQLFDSGSTYQRNALLVYGEYGITNRFTAVLNVPLLMLNQFSRTETIAGVGNIQLGIKYSLVKKFPLALSVDFDIPTDDGINFANSKSPNSLGIIEQINLPTSDGEFNIWTTLAASQSIKNGKLFTTIYGGVNFRTESFSNQWKSGMELGYLFFNKFYLIGKLGVQGKIDSKEKVTSSFLFGEGTKFTTFGITGMYNINAHWKIVAAYTDYSDFIISRKNIYDGAAISLGVALEY